MTAAPTRSTRQLRVWPWLLLAASIGLRFSWGGGGSGPTAGGLAPALRAPWTEDEQPFALASRRGHVTVVAFWATWCPACRAEGPALARLHGRIAPHGDAVVGLSLDEAPLES